MNEHCNHDHEECRHGEGCGHNHGDGCHHGENCHGEGKHCDNNNGEHNCHGHGEGHCHGGEGKGCGWGGRRDGAGRKCENKKIPFNRRLSEAAIQKIKDYAAEHDISETEALEIAVKNLITEARKGS